MFRKSNFILWLLKLCGHGPFSDESPYSPVHSSSDIMRYPVLARVQLIPRKCNQTTQLYKWAHNNKLIYRLKWKLLLMLQMLQKLWKLWIIPKLWKLRNSGNDRKVWQKETSRMKLEKIISWCNAVFCHGHQSDSLDSDSVLAVKNYKYVIWNV